MAEAGLLLTDEERKRCAEYCRMEAKKLLGILKAMRTLKIHSAVLDHVTDKIDAFETVAEDLERERG